MHPLRKFTVSPKLPKELEKLKEIAYNLRWSWNYDCIELFMRLDRDLWEETRHNPVLLLSRMDQNKLEELAKDEIFLSFCERVYENLNNYANNEKTWYNQNFKSEPKSVFAYFSAEFGLVESLPIYSGGLGVLAGDHMKSASELGLPLVGVGLLYQNGYFRQYLNHDGWQQEYYAVNDFYNLPLELQRNKDGSPIVIGVQYPGRTVYAQIWRVIVGRVSLCLLDTNIAQNSQEDQDIVDQLYGGDNTLRLKQEIMLGIGGMRALNALGLQPKVLHMNEGHSAFAALERIRLLMKENGLTFAEAREATAPGNAFTTHTPVPAGHDRFGPALMEEHFHEYYPQLGLSAKEFLALGRENPDDEMETFCMTVLAMHLAHYRNAVSKLHGEVTRKMWASLWPNLPPQEIPVSHITNGAHMRSWIANDLIVLFDRYLGPQWREKPANPEIWNFIEKISPVELWHAHERCRERLVVFTRNRVRSQLERRGTDPAEIEAAQEILDPGILTIGFARRFATYKRATLLLRDEERLVRLLTDRERPIQMVIAGKAHPADSEGKDFIRHIVHFARREEVRRRIVFIEDYDIDVARHLVKGADVWLNTPRRPREASGTSGMKAAFNGVINVSILDGWWDEAYSPEIGWAIGSGEMFDDPELQDEIEANILYDLLEKSVRTAFYERSSDGIPYRWVSLMKSSMRMICPEFNANRMVRQYTERFYVPSKAHFEKFSENDFAVAKNLSAWKEDISKKWSQIQIRNIESDSDSHLFVREKLKVCAEVALGEIDREHVTVQLYVGQLDRKGEFVNPQTVEMKPGKEKGENVFVFEAQTATGEHSGQYGYTIRVVPHHPDLERPEELGLITWAQ